MKEALENALSEWDHDNALHFLCCTLVFSSDRKRLRLVPTQAKELRKQGLTAMADGAPEKFMVLEFNSENLEELRRFICDGEVGPAQPRD